MSLIKCPECGKEISDTVKTCIHCGYILKPEESIPKSNENVQQVEISGIRLKHNPLKKIIPFVIIATVLIIAGTFLVRKNQARKLQAAKDSYIELMSQFNTKAFAGAAEAETMCNLVKKVWYNSINKESDAETDAYTIQSNGRFYDDFNDALSVLFKDVNTMKANASISVNQDSVKEIYKELKDYPTGFEENFNSCTALYDIYKDFTNLAISPTGSLQTYSGNFSDLDSDFIDKYNDITDIVEDYNQE